MREGAHEQHLQGDVDGGGQQRRLDRGCRIATGIEGRGEASHQHEGKQPDRVGGKRRPGGGRVCGGEGATGEERAHDEVGDGDGACGARDGEKERKLDAAGLSRGRALLIARGKPPRHLGQEHGADGDADHADGKLVDTVGVIERRQRAGGKKRGDQRIGEERKLHAARADNGGTQRFQETARRLRHARHTQADAVAVSFGIDADEQHLSNTREQHAPGSGMAGVREEGRQKQGRHHRQIEEDGGAGSRGEAVIGVEDAGEQRLHRNQRQIGKGDAGERHGELEPRRIVDETGGENAHDPRREQKRQSEHHEIDGDERGRDLIGEELGGAEPRLLEGTGIGRHEGRGERALGENGAEVVGKAEGDEKGVGDRACPEDRRHDHVTDKAGKARDQRQTADGGDAPNHALSRSVKGPSRSRARRI